MPHLAREMRVWVWGMRISKGDLTSPVVNDRISRVWVPRLPLETRHLPWEMQWHLQNLGYVTPLKIFLNIEKIYQKETRSSRFL
jgi:hypothetical protein